MDISAFQDVLYQCQCSIVKRTLNIYKYSSSNFFGVCALFASQSTLVHSVCRISLTDRQISLSALTLIDFFISLHSSIAQANSQVPLATCTDSLNE